MQRRELKDLEDCRIAWERGGDPLGLCIAVTKADLPEWLANALLVTLVDQHEGPTRGWMTKLLRQHWRGTRKDAIDAIRAAEVAGMRTHPEWPQTWEMSDRLAKAVVDNKSDTDIPRATPAAHKKSYQAVSKGLADAGRYYRPTENLEGRLLLALERMHRMVETELARQRERDNGPGKVWNEATAAST